MAITLLMPEIDSISQNVSHCTILQRIVSEGGGEGSATDHSKKDDGMSILL